MRPLLRSSRHEEAGGPLPDETSRFLASAEKRVTPQGFELRHLRYFVAVADAGTFTQAAEQLFIAQPTLSQQIRRLEEMVGTPLLDRRPNGVQLTAAGSVLLEESRTILSLAGRAVGLTQKAAGLGRQRLRVVIPPDLPEALSAVTVTRLQRTAKDAGVDVAWLETPLDGLFSLIQQGKADAAVGWVTSDRAMLPDRLDVMTLGEFAPQAWIPSSHPAARRHRISLGQLADLDVAHGPRRISAGLYDKWQAILRSANPRFEFADPPFQQPLLMALAFAATAGRPTAVLTGPRYPAGTRAAAREDPAVANAYAMVPVCLDQSPRTANASLVWSGDLPRPLQQIIFDTAELITANQAAA
jgi:DNA-binding transcriptional LysR family regulator